MTERELNIVLKAKDATKKAVEVAGRNLKGLSRVAAEVAKKIQFAFIKSKLAIQKMGDISRSVMRRMRLGIIAVIAAGAGLLVFIKKSIDAARIQELAERKLEAAFLGSGKATKEGIESLKKYAAQLQKTTRFGDEQIINAQAMLATFALTDKQIKEATGRVLDMAAATQQLTGAEVDLQQIAIAVGKGLTGQVGILSRYGVVISEEVKKSKDLNAILAELDKNFKGIAEVVGSATFQGSLTATGNAWGDFKEKIGSIITDSPLILAFFKTLQQGFEKLQKFVEANTDTLREFVEKGLIYFINIVEKVAKASTALGIIFSEVFKVAVNDIIVMGDLLKQMPQLFKISVIAALALGTALGRAAIIVVGMESLIRSFPALWNLFIESGARAILFLQQKANDVIELINKVLPGKFEIELIDTTGQQEYIDYLIKVTDKSLEALEVNKSMLTAALDSKNAVEAAISSIDAVFDKSREKIKLNTASVKENMEKLKEMLEGLKGVGSGSQEMAEKAKKALSEMKTKVDAVTQSIHDRFSDVIFARLTQKGKDFKETMINIFKDMGDSVLRTITNMIAKSVLTLGPLKDIVNLIAGGIVGMGGSAGVQALAPGRSTRTIPGGLTGNATGIIANTAMQRVVATSGVGGNPVMLAGTGGIQSNVGLSPTVQAVNFQNTLALLTSSLPGLIQPNAGNLIRLGGGALGQLATSALSNPGGLLNNAFQGIFGSTGTRALARMASLPSMLGGLLSSLIPLGGLGQGIGGSIGGGIGSIGGGLLASLATGNPLALLGGALTGGVLGRITGGLFGGGGENRRISTPGLDVVSNLERFNIPNTPIVASRYRDAGPQLDAQVNAIKSAFRTLNKEMKALGLESTETFNKMTEAWLKWNANYPQPSHTAQVQQNQILVDTLTKVQLLMDTLQANMTDAISNALSEGFAQVDSTQGWQSFMATFKDSIFGNFQSSMIQVLEGTDIFKKVTTRIVTPISEFLAEQLGNEDVFNVDSFNDAIEKYKEAMDSTDFSELEKIFEAVYEGFEKIEKTMGGVEIAFETAIRNGVGLGIAAGLLEAESQEGLDIFSKNFKEQIFNSMVTGITEAMLEKTLMKNAIEAITKPLEDYLSKQGEFDFVNLSEGGANVDGLQEMLEKVRDAMKDSMPELNKIFELIQSLLNDIRPDFIDKVESSFEMAVRNGVGSGIAAGLLDAERQRGLDLFSQNFKEQIFGAIVEGVTEAMLQTSLIKGTIETIVGPIEDFLKKQGDTIDIAGLQNVLGTALDTLQGRMPQLEVLFDMIYDALGGARTTLLPQPQQETVMPTASVIRIPRLQHGGEITRSGLAFVDRGERFSGVRGGISRKDLTDDEPRVVVNMSIQNLNSADAKRVGEEIGRSVAINMNTRQFMSN